MAPYADPYDDATTKPILAALLDMVVVPMVVESIVVYIEDPIPIGNVYANVAVGSKGFKENTFVDDVYVVLLTAAEIVKVGSTVQKEVQTRLVS